MLYPPIIVRASEFEAIVRHRAIVLVSAFIISILAQKGDTPLPDQSLRTYSKQVAHYGKSLKYGNEVSAFLERFPDAGRWMET